MLSEWEENRVKYLSGGPWQVNNHQTIQWLCAKLLAINEEASRYAEELQTANEELARRAELD